jgi:hypothetical protein
MEFQQNANRALKTTFKLKRNISNLLTGGKITLAADGEKIACCCDNGVNIVDLKSGNIESTLSAVSFFHVSSNYPNFFHFFPLLGYS